MGESKIDSLVEVAINIQHNIYYDGILLSLVPDLLATYKRQNITYHLFEIPFFNIIFLIQSIF